MGLVRVTNSDLYNLKLYATTAFQNGQIGKKELNIVHQVVDELIAGEWKRCAGCYKWAEATDVEMVYVNNMSKHPSSFVLCAECVDTKRYSQEKAKVVEENIRVYVKDEEKKEDE